VIDLFSKPFAYDFYKLVSSLQNESLSQLFPVANGLAAFLHRPLLSGKQQFITLNRGQIHSECGMDD
jgi:hypothetical protein